AVSRPLFQLHFARRTGPWNRPGGRAAGRGTVGSAPQRAALAGRPGGPAGMGAGPGCLGITTRFRAFPAAVRAPDVFRAPAALSDPVSDLAPRCCDTATAVAGADAPRTRPGRPPRGGGPA